MYRKHRSTLRYRDRWTAGLFALGMAACQPESEAPTVPLMNNLGTHHRPITVQDSVAQQYFDQGLRLVYAFNHAEAVASFEEGIRRDSTCAMCYWGVAYALGPNINAPMDSAFEARAFEAITHASTMLDSLPPVEQMLIRALAERYGPPGVARAARDTAWARAVKEIVGWYPDDDDVRVFTIDAMMNLRPWDYWLSDGNAAPGMGEMVAWLDTLVLGAPHNPGVCHLYIHVMESHAPERAVACAERLALQMPGAGHVVHMPAHIYVRVGRYLDAVESNRAAAQVDADYIGERHPHGIYPEAYVPHNMHFLAYAATFAGMSREAIAAARGVSSSVSAETARSVIWAEPMVPYLHLVLQVFGHWEEILALPPVPNDLPYASALASFARGMAYSATGRTTEAEAMLERIRTIVPTITEPVLREAAEIGEHVLSGDILERQGALSEAIDEYRRGVALEDGLLYNEPPYWHQPVRHFLGAALLSADRPREAERVYREDLERNPENGWALSGLGQSLRAEGKDAEDVEFRARFAWAAADVGLTRSRF